VGSAQDLDLVRRCASGDKGAWEEFVRRTRPAIMRGATVALRKFRVGDKESLENVHQQVFVELLRENGKVLRTFKGQSDLEGWVAVISMRTAYHIMRRKQPESGAIPELLPPDPTPLPAERAERREFLDKLDTAFRGLSPQENALLRLAYFEERSYKDIAESLGVPLNSVSPMLIRAKEKLKKSLE
jgi:RNA polymerase sigma-70 factor (ECF subfamily)